MDVVQKSKIIIKPEVIFRPVRSLLRPEFRLCGWIMQIGVVNLLPNELGYDMIETRYAGTTPLVGFINQCRKAG